VKSPTSTIFAAAAAELRALTAFLLRPSTDSLVNTALNAIADGCSARFNNAWKQLRDRNAHRDCAFLAQLARECGLHLATAPTE